MPARRRIGSGVISLMIANAIGMSAAAQTTGTDPIADKAALCSGCHGDNGVPANDEIPVIWGQHAGYIFLNLRDYQTGARKNELMEPVVATLSRTDMLALGEYFEKKPWPNLGQARAPADIAVRAEAMAASGQCSQCHLGGFLGDSTNPRLAGQNIGYLRKTMSDFHTGIRSNNPWMAALLKSFSDADVDAMARYLGGL